MYKKLQLIKNIYVIDAQEEETDLMIYGNISFKRQNRNHFTFVVGQTYDYKSVENGIIIFSDNQRNDNEFKILIPQKRILQYVCVN